jgi:ABC-type multidrug transport system ATPase subunit
MIQAQNVTKRFGRVTAIEGLSFQVEAGEAVALWGANGAGKTTALRCLLGVIPYQGAIRLAGHHTLYQGKQARRQLGFVPQEIRFHDGMTVAETLRFYARLKKTAPDEPSAGRLLERLGLAGSAGAQVRDLSGGMKQRLALVIALLGDPPVLVLDEPTANLDVRARDEFLSLLAELKAEGKTLVFSSHRLEEVVTLADRVLVIEGGRLVADCPPAELSHVLGRKAMLKLLLPDERWIAPAMETLSGHGFQAERNGVGVWVKVVPLEKARPISVLTEAGIPVRDFHME